VLATCNVQLSVCRGDGRIDQSRPWLKTRFVVDFSRLCVQAIGDAKLLIDPIKIAVEVNRRRDVGALVRLPKLVRCGDVAAAAGTNGDGRVLATADCEHHAVVSDNARTHVVLNPFTTPQLLAGPWIKA